MYIELTETTKHTIKTKEHRNLKKKKKRFPYF